MVKFDLLMIKIRQGIVKQILEVEGNVVSANICSDFLAIATNTGAISIYDLSRRYSKYYKKKLYCMYIFGFNRQIYKYNAVNHTN